MDAIILAAGRNDRLSGHIPAFMKPLIIVDGKPLIKTLVENIRDHVDRLVVVASPHNVGLIIDVMRDHMHHVTFMVQPQAIGPMHAVGIGGRACADDRVMIICSDNIIPKDDVSSVVRNNDADKKGRCVVTTRRLRGHEAERFTYFINDVVYEKAPVPRGYSHAEVRVWIGPLIVDRDRAACGTKYENLSHLIASYSPNGITLVDGECQDIGVPSELPDTEVL